MSELLDDEEDSLSFCLKNKDENNEEEDELEKEKDKKDISNMNTNNKNTNIETTAEENITNISANKTESAFNITMLPKKDISIEVNIISKITVKVNKLVINDEYRKMINFCEPRPEKIVNKFIKPRTPWTYPVSIWAYYDYEYDDVPESYLDKCFEFDFNRCNFNKEVKEEDVYNRLKAFLRARYRMIIDCYKYYSSIGGYSVWQITQNSLSEFVYKCPNLCDKSYGINNVYLQQKVVVGNLTDKEDRKKKNKKKLNNNRQNKQRKKSKNIRI